MSSFGNSANGLLILSSADGLTWSDHASGLTGLSGYLRDPSILQYGNQYFVAFTDAGAFGQDSVTSFGMQSASASDLSSWTRLPSVETGVVGANRVWSPEFFVDDDGTVYIFVAVSPDGGTTTSHFRVWAAHALDSTLTSWSAFTQVLDDTRFPIDPFVVKRGSTYCLWYKDNNTGFIEYASSSSPTSGYSVQQTGNWAGWGNGFEGPCLVLLPGGTTWRMYMDAISDNVGQSYSESTDSWATWSAAVPIVTGAPANHGTTIIVH